MGLCRSEFPLDRTDHGLGEAVERGLLILTSKGTYNHLLHENITDEDIATINRLVKAFLDQKEEGISLHLNSMVYQKSPQLQEFEYYVVRHAVRNFGETHDVYFSGKSQADTVSLSSEVTSVSQKDAIMKWVLEKDNRSFVSDELVPLLRSKSHGHAKFYISELVAEHRLVRNTYNTYSTPETSFKGLPIQGIVETIDAYMSRTDRPVEIGTLADICNQTYNLNKPKWLFTAIINHNQDKMKTKLSTHFNTVFVGAVDENSSVFKIVRTAPDIWNTQEIINLVQDKVDASEAVINMAISQVKNGR
jgi:hypothetical protein